VEKVGPITDLPPRAEENHDRGLRDEERTRRLPDTKHNFPPLQNDVRYVKNTEKNLITYPSRCKNKTK
jgi:hypothetical protein